MTQEINKVIEDKAKDISDSILAKCPVKRFDRDDLNTFCYSSAIKGMKEALSNPTDIGLCRWVEADDKMPEKPVKDNLYLSIKYNGEPSCLESVGGNWVWNLGNDVTISQWQKIEWLQE